MPNHFHVIIEKFEKTFVGADLRVCPMETAGPRVCPNDGTIVQNQGGHTGPPLHAVIIENERRDIGYG